ncbi:hypothetical protein MYAM1_000989 [Malassezia yamatoensis]|uniref:Mitochondrial fission process protein 1 n=1 Tax=Malassezia yamatoensis TaxID=253288 RepID=A0AAJ6CFY8_9BASI|nr:hypothetical protein MYAM1_000989 [Malassezia yamatoensis]
MSHAEEEVQSHHTYSSQEDEGIGRYSAYAIRLRTLLTSSSRYIAYSSDVGEAFRPLTKPSVVRAAYAVSWAYIFTDVGYTCYKSCQGRDLHSSKTQQDVSWIASRRLVFQLLSSLFLPAVTIHSVVKYSAPVFAKSRFLRVRSVGPTVAGLLTVPLLPMLFDEPVEIGVDYAFDLLELKVQEYFGSRQAEKALRARMENLKDMLWKTPKSKDSIANLTSTNATVENRMVDEVGTQESSPLMDSSTATKLAVLGVGVDLVYLPRMRSLVSRHAQRLSCGSLSGSLSQVPRFATPQRQDEKPSQESLLSAAAQHFAKRTLSSLESTAWHQQAPFMQHEDRLRFLATRWACKEAAYKAVYPHIHLRARDISMSRGETRLTAKPQLQLDPQKIYRSLDGASVTELAHQLTLHASISHDGDYVIASVLAESS